MIIFKLTLKQKCIKLCKQFKYYHEIRLKHQNLVKRTKFTYFERCKTKLVKHFKDGLISNFTETT